MDAPTPVSFDHWATAVVGACASIGALAWGLIKAYFQARALARESRTEDDAAARQKRIDDAEADAKIEEIESRSRISTQPDIPSRLATEPEGGSQRSMVAVKREEGSQ